MTGRQLAVLHLRQAAGAGGGADSVLADELRLAVDTPGVKVAIAYLRKRHQELKAIADRIRPLGVAYQEIPGARFMDLGQLARLGEIITGECIDILHCHDPKSDVYGYLLARRIPGLVLFSTLHGWTRSSWRGRFYAWLDLRALRRFHHVIAVAPALAATATGAGIEGVIPVDNGVDTDYWSPPAITDASPMGRPGHRVGFVGRLSTEKDPETLVRTFELLARRVPSARLLVAGDGPERARLTALAKRFDVQDKVEMLGWLERDGLKRFYSQLDVLLLTSRTEGLPMAVLEALAMEVPVVATRVGGVDAIVRHRETGLLAESGDAEALTEAVFQLVQDGEMARTLARAGRRLVVERHSLAEKWKRHLELYRAALPGQ